MRRKIKRLTLILILLDFGMLFLVYGCTNSLVTLPPPPPRIQGPFVASPTAAPTVDPDLKKMCEELVHEREQLYTSKIYAPSADKAAQYEKALKDADKALDTCHKEGAL